MADRCTLHRKRLDEFSRWAAERGWTREPEKGHYEVLRLRHPDKKHPFLAYDRGSPEHLSIPRDPDGKNSNMALVRRFLHLTRGPRA